jgi:hypothetical protein
MKPRTQGAHLNDAEIARLRVAFNCDRRSGDIAAELPCSPQIANKYYRIFRDAATPPPAPTLPSRFYKSNFEL